MADPAQFEAHRERLRAIAARMVGEADVDDVMQEAAVRWMRAEPPDNAAALSTTIVTRLCLDLLRAAPRRRERPLTEHLPSLADPQADAPTTIALAESLGHAFRALLQQLTPVERAVFVLREVFSYDYADVARIVERSEANCRQILRRARAHLRASRPRFEVTERAHRRLADGFFAAVAAGDVRALEELLGDDAVLTTDAGAARVAGLRATGRPVVGRAEVIRFATAVVRALGGSVERERCELLGRPAVLVRVQGVVRGAVLLDVGARVRGVHVVTDPGALALLR